MFSRGSVSPAFGACRRSRMSLLVTPPCQTSMTIWPVKSNGNSSMSSSTQCGSSIGFPPFEYVSVGGRILRRFTSAYRWPLRATKLKFSPLSACRPLTPPSRMIHIHDTLIAPVEFHEPIPPLLRWRPRRPNHSSTSPARSNRSFVAPHPASPSAWAGHQRRYANGSHTVAWPWRTDGTTSVFPGFSRILRGWNQEQSAYIYRTRTAEKNHNQEVLGEVGGLALFYSNDACATQGAAEIA